MTNPPRQFGKSNYGISRTFRVFLDLISTKFWLDYSTKPMHFFGFFGVAATAGGVLTGSLLLFQKVSARRIIRFRPDPRLWDDRTALGWSSNHLFGIGIGDVVTYLLRIPEETNIRH